MNDQYPFLAGGGEMGRLTRHYDWSKSALGTPDTWPQSLRTTLSILLNSKFPMFLFWGEELLCFYNDAYRPSLGNNGKHPGSLGQPGAQVWPEIWDQIKPLIDQVLLGGEATWSEDQLIPIYRNGRLEDVYWTFSYSPVSDESGRPMGVFVTCTETTGQVNLVQQLQLSDQRFQNLVREATVGIIVLSGQETQVTIVNDAYARLIDRRADELLNKPLFSVIPEAEAVFQPIIDQVRLSGQPLYLYDQPYFVYVNGGRKEGFLDLVYQPYKELDGAITGVMVLCQDTTAQVLARRQLEASEMRLRSLVESAPFPIGVYVGRDMKIQFANQSIIDVWGKGPDVVGQRYADVLPELANQGIYEQLEGVYTTGIPYHANNQRVDLVVDGQLQPYYFKYSFTPLFDAEGQVFGVMNTAADVTDLVQAQQQLELSEERYRTLYGELEQVVQQRTEELAATNEELAAINEELTATNEQYAVSNEELLESTMLLSRSNSNLEQFAYVASHDLQEPLRKIQQFGDLLKGQYADQLGAGAAYLDRMQSAASRMSTLIRDLLTFSRIATQQETREPVSLNAVINTTLTDLELVIAETEAEVQVEDLPTVIGDPLQLGQLFSNLLNNALKFRRPGVAPIVQVKAGWLAADHLPADIKLSRGTIAYHLIEVIDNGIGFDEKYRDRMFQVFQRLHGRSEYAGTGIGLAICQKVVTNHGGAITATSQPGQGATFRVYLPV